MPKRNSSVSEVLPCGSPPDGKCRDELAVPVGPPKFRVVHDHLGKVAFVEFDGLGLSGLQIYFLTESDVTRSDGTFYRSFALGIALLVISV